MEGGGGFCAFLGGGVIKKKGIPPILHFRHPSTPPFLDFYIIFIFRKLVLKKEQEKKSVTLESRIQSLEDKLESKNQILEDKLDLILQGLDQINQSKEAAAKFNQ